MQVIKRLSYTQHGSKAGSTCENMQETAAYFSTITGDQHAVKMTNPVKA